MELKVRPLKTRDIFTLSRIFSKLNIDKATLLAALKAAGSKREDQAAAAGVEVFMGLANNLGGAEEELTSFLADLIGMKREALADADLEVASDIFAQLLEQPKLRAFFKLRSPATR